MAKESVVSSLLILFGSEAALSAALTPAQAAPLLVFCLLYTPASRQWHRSSGSWAIVGGHHGGESVRRGMAVRFAGASGGCGAVLRKTIGMRSALLCAYSVEELFIIEQCRAVCGPPGIAFSRVGSWRKTASAALISCGNSRAAGRTLSGSLRSPAPPKGELYLC